MGAIFGKADGVLAWLGDSTDGSDVPMAFLERLLVQGAIFLAHFKNGRYRILTGEVHEAGAPVPGTVFEQAGLSRKLQKEDMRGVSDLPLWEALVNLVATILEAYMDDSRAQPSTKCHSPLRAS
jgi:hypothetical protein